MPGSWTEIGADAAVTVAIQPFATGVSSRIQQFTYIESFRFFFLPLSLPMLRAGVFYGSPSRFPVPFFATPQQRSMQRSMITYGGKPATLQYDQYPDRDCKLIIQY